LLVSLDRQGAGEGARATRLAFGTRLFLLHNVYR
jgi:hypothetical protein